VADDDRARKRKKASSKSGGGRGPRRRILEISLEPRGLPTVLRATRVAEAFNVPEEVDPDLYVVLLHAPASVLLRRRNVRDVTRCTLYFDRQVLRALAEQILASLDEEQGQS
jgi:hypothetical protein